MRMRYRLEDIEHGYASVWGDYVRFAGFVVSDGKRKPSWFAGDRAGKELRKCKTRKSAVAVVVKHDRKLSKRQRT